MQSLARNPHYSSGLSEVPVNFVHKPSISIDLFPTLTNSQRLDCARQPTIISKSYHSVDQSRARNFQSSRSFELAGELRRFIPKPANDNVRFIAANDNARIFPPKQGAKSGRQRVEGSFEDLLDRAGIKDFRFHDLRHTFASWYMMNGGDLYELAKVLGHSNIKMTERYAKLARQHIARTSSTARGMWKLLEPICDKANVG
jgi:integrase